jgi:hypothetical protein
MLATLTLQFQMLLEVVSMNWWMKLFVKSVYIHLFIREF